MLAFSLHEIATILGQEKTVLDLLAVLDEYCTKDLDDVKYGVLTHLADFFEASSGCGCGLCVGVVFVGCGLCMGMVLV